jgi:hypothetical protein
MAARKQSRLTIDETFQRFYRQEKGGPHVACEQFNQALREGLPLWVVDLRVLPPEGLADVPDYFAIPPEERQPVEVKPGYFASHYRVAVEQAQDGGWTAKMTSVGHALMPPADQFEWTVSAAHVNSLLNSESSERKRGRKPKFDWASIKREIAQRCIDEKTGRVQVPLPDNEGKLAKTMLDWCGTKFDEIPSDPAMRAAVKEICAMLRPD